MKEKRKRKASDPIIEARIREIMQIRLDGAEQWDCMSYVSQKEQADEFPWKKGEDGKPLSTRQIRRYIAKADKELTKEQRTLDPTAFYKHLAKLRSIYARAVNTGDLSNARAILHDLAALQDFYPAKKVKTETSAYVKLDTIDDLTRAELDEERRRLEGLCPRPTEDSSARGPG